ncbi:hypothetical protein BT69DRAFT_1312775 [Atractiella rhizophila]|nr:hypothetical protein BT69DRAFT_1312775 [Atractiella rhizophila]
MAQPVVKPQELNPLLARYLQSLATRPLLTKACTAGTLSKVLLQEVIAGQITGAKVSFKPSGNPALDVVQANQRALKMGAYGFFVSAPLGHTLLGVLTKLFEGKTSAKARIAQILCSNIFISPIQQSVYLFCMGYINGAKSVDQAMAYVKLGFWRIMKLTWIISPLSMAFAQKFLDPSLWVPFFNLVAFCAGLYVNVQTKKRKEAAEKAARAKELSEKSK